MRQADIEGRLDGSLDNAAGNRYISDHRSLQDANISLFLCCHAAVGDVACFTPVLLTLYCSCWAWPLHVPWSWAWTSVNWT